ncbi:GreA/GreB family elongation factor [Bradyrhizobium sp. WU425]|uniref:GreA/GreB family elongation factor n=1 Tax=Bradyrhizobium sp. WU425 TaxID=187029 RepID=UPI00404936C3
MIIMPTYLARRSAKSRYSVGPRRFVANCPHGRAVRLALWQLHSAVCNSSLTFATLPHWICVAQPSVFIALNCQIKSFVVEGGRWEGYALRDKSTMTNAEQRRPDRPCIVLTRMDRQKLLRLLQDFPTRSVDTDCLLREEIDRADMISDTTAWSSAVRLGCEVKFVEIGTSHLRRGRLVLPDETRTANCISVLSPIGTALLGLGPGQSIRWTERGRERSLAVLEVRASGVSPQT